MKTSVLQASPTSESAHQLVPHEALISSEMTLKLAPSRAVITIKTIHNMSALRTNHKLFFALRLVGKVTHFFGLLVRLTAFLNTP